MVGLLRWRYPCNDSAVVANQAIAFTNRFSLFTGQLVARRWNDGVWKKTEKFWCPVTQCYTVHLMWF